MAGAHRNRAPFPLKIMRQNEARATKTRTGISRRGSIRRISSEVPGTTNKAEVKGYTPVGDWLICELKVKMVHYS